MSKYTDGPWHICDTDLNVSQVGISGSKPYGKKGYTTIARMVNCKYGMDAGEIIANCHLIAAAPELLSCLISLLDKADREFKDSGIWVATREDARQAIKLATGDN